MKLRDSIDGNARFEGDHALRWQSIPEKARIVSAKATVTPIDSKLGGPFAEPISFSGVTGDFGATKTVAATWVEVDFHTRRTLASVAGSFTGASLQVDVGGGTYVEINQVGAFKTPSDVPPADIFLLNGSPDSLPGLTVAKLKLTNTGASPQITSLTIRSVPANVSLRLGDLSPFWTHVGEMTQPQTSSDFAAVLQAALTSAKVVNGFYDLPLVIHSDSIARLQVELEVEFLAEVNPLPPGLQEIVLPFDYSTLAQSQAAVLNVAVPPNSRVVPGRSSAHVAGSFGETRIAYGPRGAVTPAAAVEVSPACSQAQMIALDATVSATAIDLLIGPVKSAARLRLDLRADLDGKPGDDSLLSGPVEITLDAEAAREPRWVSLPLPGEFVFAKAQENKLRYWLVLQSLDGTAAWSVTQPEPGAMSMQCTRDGGLAWRESLALKETLRDATVSAGGPFAALFRLRWLPKQFEVPIELQVGEGKHEVRVGLDRFAPLGRVDFVLDAELAQGINEYLDKTAPGKCPETEHLVNRDFEQWLRVGDQVTQKPVKVSGNDLGAVAFAPNGKLAYLLDSVVDEFARLRVIDAGCDHEIEAVAITLGIFSATMLIISPNGERGYVATGNQLQVIDTRSSQVLGPPLTFPTGSLVQGLAISPDGARLYASLAGNRIEALDTAKLEQGQISVLTPPGVQATTNDTTSNFKALTVSPDGSSLYLVFSRGATNGIVRVIDAVTLKAGADITVAFDPRGIALTPDGRSAVVVNFGSNTVSVIDTLTRNAVPLEVGQSPIAVAVSSDGARAYVLNGGSTSGGSISIVDLKARAVTKSIPVSQTTGTLFRPGFAVAPTEDHIYFVAHPDGFSLESIQFGTRLPAEWHLTSGAVTPLCLPPPFHLVAALGSDSMPTGLSQVVPVVESCPYEFSFWGIAVEPETDEPPAVAEVLWLSSECGLVRADQVLIEVLEPPAPPAITTVSSAAAAQNDAFAMQALVLHLTKVMAPAGVDQAEVRFSVPTGGKANIDLVSLGATAETLANADFMQMQEGRLVGWTLSPGSAPGVSMLATEDGIRFQNAGAATAELVQTVAAKPNEPFTLEFQGGAAGRSAAQANPRVELRWLKAGKGATGTLSVIELLPDALGSSVAGGTSPQDAVEAEIHLIVPAGTSQEIKRVSVRFSAQTTVPVTFIAQARGELRISDVRIAFEQVESAAPPVPDRGLCTATPPGRPPGETSGDSCFCHNCESEQTLVEAEATVTAAGRPAAAGRCGTCGSELVRLGGPSISGAQPLSLRSLSGSQPVLIRPRISAGRAVARDAQAIAAIPLTAIRGIGEARARQLVEIGIDSVEKLAKAAPETVAQIKFITAEMAAHLVAQAKALKGGVST